MVGDNVALAVTIRSRFNIPVSFAKVEVRVSSASGADGGGSGYDRVIDGDLDFAPGEEKTYAVALTLSGDQLQPRNVVQRAAGMAAAGGGGGGGGGGDAATATAAAAAAAGEREVATLACTAVKLFLRHQWRAEAAPPVAAATTALDTPGPGLLFRVQPSRGPATGERRLRVLLPRPQASVHIDHAGPALVGEPLALSARVHADGGGGIANAALHVKCWPPPLDARYPYLFVARGTPLVGVDGGAATPPAAAPNRGTSLAALALDESLQPAHALAMPREGELEAGEKRDWEAVIWCRVSAAAVHSGSGGGGEGGGGGGGKGGEGVGAPQRDACKQRRVALQVGYEPGGGTRVLCGEVAAAVSCKAPFRVCFDFAQCQGRLGPKPALAAATGSPGANGSCPAVVLREEMLMQVTLTCNARHPLELLGVRIVAANNDAVSQNADCPLTLFPGDEYSACFHVCPVLVREPEVASFGRLVAQWRRHVPQRPATAAAAQAPPKMSSSFPIPPTLATAEALSAAVRTPAFACVCEPFVAVLRTENRSGEAIKATCHVTDLGNFFVDGAASKTITLPPFSARSLAFSLVATAVGELLLPKVAVECVPAAAGGATKATNANPEAVVAVAVAKSIFIRPK